MSASFFSTVTRYVPMMGRHPREDMLTQALAATINVDPGLGGELVAAWTGESGPDPTARHYSAVPQFLPAGSSKRIDLCLVPDGQGPHIWVEIKLDAGLSGDRQLHNYQRLIDRHAPGSVLVFLAPVGRKLEGCHKPKELVEADWQRVGSIVSAWSEVTAAPEARWIAGEFVAHLEEENLYMSKPFTSTDLAVVRNQVVPEQLA